MRPTRFLSDNAGLGFYLVTADGRRGGLKRTAISIEVPVQGTPGPVRYAVIKVQGEYVDETERFSPRVRSTTTFSAESDGSGSITSSS